MTRLVRPRELLLLVSASVPLSLAFTAWPPPQEVTIVKEVECCEPPVAPDPEPIVTAEAWPVEPKDEPASQPEPAAPQEWRYGADFLWVLQSYGGASRTVVLALEIEEAWAAAVPRALDRDDLVMRAVDEGALPAALRERVGQRVELHGRDGKLCEAVIGAPELIAEATGDLEMFDDDAAQRSTELYEMDDEERRAILAPMIWEYGRRLLVAPLAAPADCGDDGELVWARPLGQPELRPLRPGKTARPRSAMARSFLAQPELVSVADELAYYVNEALPESYGQAEADSTRPSPRLRDHLRARRWSSDGVARVATVAVEGDLFSFEGCGLALHPEWGVALIEDDAVDTVRVGPHGTPVSILDVTGDGQLEIVVEGNGWSPDVLLTITPDGLEQRTALPAVPFFGCPC
jgi:hypothetical protein